MKSPAHDIALYLAASGVGTMPHSTGWAVGAVVELDQPDDSVTVYDTGGEGPDTDDMDPDNCTFQVRVRSASYPTAYAKQEEIRNLLLLVAPIEAIGDMTSRFVGINMTSGFLALGRDDRNRHLITANYRAIRSSKE